MIRGVAAALLAAALLAGPPAPGGVELLASRDGFSPRTLTLHVGEPVRIQVRTADGEHCVAIDALRVEKRVVPSRPAQLDLTPDRAGTFEVYCCLGGDHAGETRTRLVVKE